jgi:hypothetical protein
MLFLLEHVVPTPFLSIYLGKFKYSLQERLSSGVEKRMALISHSTKHSSWLHLPAE